MKKLSSVIIIWCLILFALSYLPSPKTRIISSILGENFTKEEPDENIISAFSSPKGYAIETTAPGYVDNITLLVGVDKSGIITSVYVLDMAETPGLGQKAAKDKFLNQFIGSWGDAEVGLNINSITGATVTSKAVAKAVNAASAYVTGADISTGATEWGG